MVSIPAKIHGTCRVSQRPIRPGDKISPWMGLWALTDEVVRFERKARADYEFRSQMKAFIDRLPMSSSR